MFIYVHIYIVLMLCNHVINIQSDYIIMFMTVHIKINSISFTLNSSIVFILKSIELSDVASFIQSHTDFLQIENNNDGWKAI